ncbi:response regulator [Brevundimonas sp.]|uniref:response regulator n=1 Tax=Brevundimonas sp. TaxID=1871086 RepID=UPI00286C1257|nr:response regulator [Brevundimonas sp.]
MSAADEPLRESAVFNLTGAVVMVVDDSPFSMEVTIQALQGFGIRVKYAVRNAAEAIEILKLYSIDLLLVDCEMDGHELVRWLRRSGLEPNAYVPVIMTASHVRRSRVADVRDCGANFLVTKPFSAAVVLERIIWVARDNRPFLETGDYSGPDRRFKASKPRDENERRADMLRLGEHLSHQAAANQESVS